MRIYEGQLQIEAALYFARYGRQAGALARAFAGQRRHRVGGDTSIMEDKAGQLVLQGR